jgi:glucuronate isomerase
MKEFFGSDIFLTGEIAKELYELVKDMPIIDYHCHLSPKEIYENRRFADIGSLWLEGDHYKWRLMRAGGISEEFITGSASFDEKFLAFAKILPLAAGNPVYHWAHMELKMYFGINEPLNSDTSEEILKEANSQMKNKEFTTRSLMKMSNVEVVCTTDDPADSLEYHMEMIKKPFGVGVRPSFRPDKAVSGITQPYFAEYVKKLTGGSVSFTDWLDTLTNRLDFFCDAGCRVSDLSLSTMPKSIGSYAQAKAAFDKAISNDLQNGSEDDYISYMLCFLAKMYAERDIVMQLHLSASRNNSTRLFRLLGLDCGNDSVGASLNINSFGKLLDRIESESGLPKLIVYTLNPRDYYMIATMLGCFQGSVKGTAQLGAAWWFCDHIDGIVEQMKVLSATGLLGKFNGMLTDSRSFTSFARHDFFRRILCSFIGVLVSKGEYDKMAATMLVQAVSYKNAKDYFGI